MEIWHLGYTGTEEVPDIATQTTAWASYPAKQLSGMTVKEFSSKFVPLAAYCSVASSKGILMALLWGSMRTLEELWFKTGHSHEQRTGELWINTQPEH